jgi:hypothetical protein
LSKAKEKPYSLKYRRRLKAPRDRQPTLLAKTTKVFKAVKASRCRRTIFRPPEHYWGSNVHGIAQERPSVQELQSMAVLDR